MTYSKDYHEFPKPYVDKNGVKWFGFGAFDIEFHIENDSIDYPNGLTRRLEEPVIDDHTIHSVTMSSEDGSEVVYEDDVPKEALDFFEEQFDPEDYKEFLV